MRLRIATFNLENLDEPKDDEAADLLERRIALMRPQFLRLDADVLCLQEVNGQERSGQPRDLHALDALLAGTPYAGFWRVATRTVSRPQVYDERNLVILSRYPFAGEPEQVRDVRFAPFYTPVSGRDVEQSRRVHWERPILKAAIDVDGALVTLLNVHLKSKRPTDIPDMKVDRFTFRSAASWAEGSFISAMKRLGQAVEIRALLDELFEVDADAFVLLAGDFNETADEPAMRALRGEVEDHNNPDLAHRTMLVCATSVSEDRRFSLVHHGRGEMIDHVLASRALLRCYRGTEVHNELLHDESRAFAVDAKFPESDHAPVVAHFDL